MFGTVIASSTDSSGTGDDGVRELYEQYRAAESDAKRREIALEMGNLTDAATRKSMTHSNMNKTEQ